IRFLARDEDPHLALLQSSATPDGACVRGQNRSAAIAAGGRPALDVNLPIDSNPENLNPLQLEELDLAAGRPAAQLPETKIPPAKRLRQFVDFAGRRCLQKHDPSPVADFNLRRFAVFRLDCTHPVDSLEEPEKRRTSDIFPEVGVGMI